MCCGLMACRRPYVCGGGDEERRRGGCVVPSFSPPSDGGEAVVQYSMIGMHIFQEIRWGKPMPALPRTDKWEAGHVSR